MHSGLDREGKPKRVAIEQCHKSMDSPFEHCLTSTKWTVIPIPALKDNYMYLIIDRTTNKCAAVDIAEPVKIVEAANRASCSIDVVLTTHSHTDHDGGNASFSSQHPAVPIVGGVGDNVTSVTREVSGDEIEVGKLRVRVIETPYHTSKMSNRDHKHSGHVSYYVQHLDEADGDGAVFTGDAVFVCGCGSLNSGSKDELHAAFRKIGELPKRTLMYPGHEYTYMNFAYASTVEPLNSKMLDKRAWVQQRYSQNLPTVPSTIAEEHETSPFMRAAFGSSSDITELSKCSDPADALLFLRQDKTQNAWSYSFVIED